MFDIGWSELALCAAVALIVIGPKDLPRALHTLGQWTARARGMMREFQRGIEDIARQSELDEMRKQIQAAETEMRQEIGNPLDPTIHAPPPPPPEPLTAELPDPTLVDPAAAQPTAVPVAADARTDLGLAFDPTPPAAAPAADPIPAELPDPETVDPEIAARIMADHGIAPEPPAAPPAADGAPGKPAGPA